MGRAPVVHKVARISHKNFVKYLSCFFDIPLSYVAGITGLSYKSIDKAREEYGKGDKGVWPFTLIKRAISSRHSWKSVNDTRESMMAHASSSIRAVLWDVKCQAEIMRMQSLSPLQRIWIEHRTVDYLTATETQEAMRNMVDLPAQIAMKILKAPMCMFNRIMNDIGITAWPDILINEGGYHITAEAVSQKRKDIIRSLPDESPVKHLLLMAETMKRACAPLQPPPSPVSPERTTQEAAPATEELPFDPAPLFAEDDDETPPAQCDNTIEEEKDDSWFWGRDTELSPRSREYWDSLAELTQENVT